MDDALKFSRTVIFLVSGISSFIFYFITKFLEGGHSQLLLIIGTVATTLVLCCWIGKSVFQRSEREKKELSPDFISITIQKHNLSVHCRNDQF